MSEGRIRAHKDRLTCDGRTQLDDAPPDRGVRRAANLAPLTRVEGRRGLFFKRGMPPEGVHLGGIGFWGALRIPVPGPEELDLDVFCSKQALLLGHQPREVEDCLTVLIGDFLQAAPSRAGCAT